MKKIIIALLAVSCIFSLAGCIDDQPVNKISSDSQVSQESTEPSSEESDSSTAATVGETLDYNGLKITLDSVENYVDTGDFVLDEPEEGKQFVVLNFTVSNETGKDDHINMFYQEAYCDDVAIDSEALLFNHSGETLWGDVANGKKRVGYVAYELPEEWQKFEFNYKVNGTQKMEFIVTPEDMA